ncbi:MAG: Hpt domain-containing protein [Methylobacter sp.]|nr:Hpt domain-containing protein [Methylobacter sp.]
MPLKTKQPGQFVVLMTGVIDINRSSLEHRRQNIIVAHNHTDILKFIATTKFDLILLDLTVICSLASVPDRLRHSRHPWQSKLIARIKDPAGINNKTPIIAISHPTEDAQRKAQYPMEFDDSLTSPITAEQLNTVIDLWQTKALALNYIQIIQLKTKNNHQLTLTLFEKLFEELPLQIIDIKDALENKQYDLAQAITHKLNGSVSFCGLTDIQQPANALESCLLKNDYAAIDQQFLMLQQHTLNFTCHQESILTNLGKC